MNIKVNTSFFPDYFRKTIKNSEEIKQFYVKNYCVNSEDNIGKYSLFEFPGSIKEFEDLLNSLLQKNSIYDYTVAPGHGNRGYSYCIKGRRYRTTGDVCL